MLEDSQQRFFKQDFTTNILQQLLPLLYVNHWTFLSSKTECQLKILRLIEEQKYVIINERIESIP